VLSITVISLLGIVAVLVVAVVIQLASKAICLVLSHSSCILNTLSANTLQPAQPQPQAEEDGICHNRLSFCRTVYVQPDSCIVSLAIRNQVPLYSSGIV